MTPRMKFDAEGGCGWCFFALGASDMRFSRKRYSSRAPTVAASRCERRSALNVEEVGAGLGGVGAQPAHVKHLDLAAPHLDEPGGLDLVEDAREMLVREVETGGDYALFRV